MKTMRKGAKVRYIGTEYKDLVGNRIFTVIQKTYSHITLYFPTVYLGGEVHDIKVSMRIADFELVK